MSKPQKVASVFLYILALPFTAVAMVCAFFLACAWLGARYGWMVGTVIWHDAWGGE